VWLVGAHPSSCNQEQISPVRAPSTRTGRFLVHSTAILRHLTATGTAVDDPAHCSVAVFDRVQPVVHAHDLGNLLGARFLLEVARLLDRDHFALDSSTPSTR
jgi:hypothetical protein